VNRQRTMVWMLSALLAGALGDPAAAQLDSGCFVSALNRTARVGEDGTWVLANVPVNSGPVRIRATCLDEGTVRSGQSGFVTVPPGGVVAVPGIDFTNPVPVPDYLTLQTPVTALTEVGETAQLQALATYPGGGVGNVTAAVTGTDYRSSNPAIASIDSEGVVTAGASGVVLLSATNEGALGVLTVSVELSGDSDGDGLPDDYELAHGLDPNNPIDVLEDPDADGLSSIDEYQAGLDPFDPDSDGDGLLDGGEVNSFGTDASLFDTDGDGLGDGLEVATGSNPLDPLDFNLAQALAGMEISPETFVLIYNTLLGEGSTQLSVSGVLTDGNRIDLNEPRYGTAFTSSDLSICNFGAQPGQVFAGAMGACTVTATNSGYSAAAQGTVESFSPTVVGAIDLPPFANNVAIHGDVVFVAGGPAGLHAIDVANRAAPALLSTLPLPGNANDVLLRGNLAFVAAGSAGLHVVDVADPAAPVLLASLDTPGDAIDLATAGSFVYVADGPAGLAVVEVDETGNPVLRSSLDTPGNANGVDVAGTLVVVSNEGSPTSVIDISDPMSPVLVSSADMGASTYDAVLVPPFAYLASANNLRVLDLSTPAAPVYRGDFGAGLFMTEAIVEPGGLLFSTQVRPDTPMPIFGLTDPAQPAFISNIVFSQFGLGTGDGTGLAADGTYVYFTATRAFEAAYKPGVTGNTRLYIAQYLRTMTIEDDGGLPPSVAITSPISGEAFKEGSSVTVTVAASDDVAVARVELLVDGAVVAEKDQAPYQFTLHVPLDVSAITLTARAHDFGSNVADSAPVGLVVLPDAPPEVTITAPAAGTSALEDTVVGVDVSATDDVGVSRVDLLVDGAVEGTDLESPYAFSVRLPLDHTGVELTARAVDTIGQVTDSDPVALSILPDPPPTVAITDPSDGETFIETTQISVAAEAADNRAVVSVRLLVNGVEEATAPSPPYDFQFPAPLGDATLLIEAEARDDLGRTSSDQIQVFVEPDPDTTAVGRVLDDTAAPVEGAEVDCLGESGETDAAGTFTVPGIPTLPGAVQCTAAFTTPAGELRQAISPVRSPVVRGVTDMSDLKPAPFLLYGGFSPDSFGVPSSLALLNPESLEGSLLGDTAVAGGLSGLAFDSTGRLFATTSEGLPGARTSRLLEIDPDSGAVLADLGPVTEGAGTGSMSVGDLAVQPGTDVLFTLRTGEDGLGQPGKLYVLDPTSGVASILGDTGTSGEGGLAFDSGGSLFTTRWDPVQQVCWLRKLSPTDGSPVADKAIPDALGAFSGLAARPSDGLLFATLLDFTGVMTIDSASGFSTAVGYSDLGLFDDLAFRPTPSAQELTTVTGRVIDNFANPVAGILVTVRRVFSSETRSDGRFTISRVPVGYGDIVVDVPPSPFSSQAAHSDTTAPLAGDTTDVGDIVVQGGVSAIIYQAKAQKGGASGGAAAASGAPAASQAVKQPSTADTAVLPTPVVQAAGASPTRSGERNR
jgi:hypothetical protein